MLGDDDDMTSITHGRPQLILYTASPVIAGFEGSSALYRKVSGHGTRILIEPAERIDPIKAFVYASSASAIHDPISDRVDADEFFSVLRYPKQMEIY